MKRLLLNRRHLFLTTAGGIGVVASGWPNPLAAQALTPPTLTVFLLERGRSPVAPTTRSAALSAFARRALPLGYAHPSDSKITALPNLAWMPEPALWHQTAVTMSRYFQARTLYEACTSMAASRPDKRPPNVLLAPDTGQPLALSGLSPTGLRCAFLVPQASSPAWIESHPARIVAARGGHLVRLDETTSAQTALAAAQVYLDDAAGDPKQLHATLYLDLAGPPEAVAALAEALAEDIAERDRNGYLIPLAPGELAARHARGSERLIGLRLDPPVGTATDDPALTAFSNALDDAGLSYSIARDDPNALRPADTYRIDPVAARTTGIPDAARGWHTATVAPRDAAVAPILSGAGIVAATGAGPDGLRGLDSNALLHLGPEIAVNTVAEIGALPDQLALCEDVVLTIDTRAAGVPAYRNALVQALRALAAVPGLRIVDLAEFTRLVGASDPIADTLHRTRAMAPEIAPRDQGAPSPEERAALINDARRAWSYFATVTHEETGLPDTTVAFEPDGTPGSSLDMLTQWDTGSALFGWIAARALGFISRAQFHAWSDKVIAALAATTLPEPRLPRAMFHAGAPWRGTGDYNICDVARLLTALKALERWRPEGDTAVRDLVAGWDLAATVIDGVPHSLDRGTLRTAADTHCTSYIKRGFALWGIEARSRYDVYYRGATEADASMHLLELVADIGTLGAEPLLMEALEFGADAPGRVLIDVLMAAQIDEWRTSGHLIAPSEGPLDRPPWFSYQGLRLDRSGPDRWDVITLTPDGATHTAAFRAATRMVTSKAPFLWAAAHPHGYCDKLLAYVRAHGQGAKGFVSGIYAATDTPTLNYADVNTNGVILEAIVARLGVVTPLPAPAEASQF